MSDDQKGDKPDSPGKVSSRAAGSRSVSIGRDAVGNIIQIGDHNVASIRKVTLPPPDSVDIRSELEALQALLTRLETEDHRKIENALADAGEELSKSEPDKDEVGKALERALDYAQKTNEFAGIVEELTPRIVKATAWLGENWHKLLGLVGLAV